MGGWGAHHSGRILKLLCLLIGREVRPYGDLVSMCVFMCAVAYCVCTLAPPKAQTLNSGDYVSRGVMCACTCTCTRTLYACVPTFANYTRTCASVCLSIFMRARALSVRACACVCVRACLRRTCTCAPQACYILQQQWALFSLTHFSSVSDDACSSLSNLAPQDRPVSKEYQPHE